MFMHLGSPQKLSDLGVTCPNLNDLKIKIKIAVIDDQKFLLAKSLKTHGFNITEIGGNITSVDQVMAYPVVICDIKGVGKAFGSPYEGAHVLSEIRKSYPDKYLITYSGMTYDASYNQSLSTADASATKDANIDYWTNLLETGLTEVGDPRKRWIRFRKGLLEKGVDLFELFKLEQNFIKSIQKRNPAILERTPVSDEIRDLVIKFSAVALVEIVQALIK